ncbi:hypothetical protein MTO96_037083 [Rhipicephalus appendiculatus]
MSGSISTNAVSLAGSSPNDLGSDSGSVVSQFSQAGNELIGNLDHNVSSEGNSRSQSPDPTTASRQQRLIPTGDRDNEDALSSVSERTAVPGDSREDVGRRVQARARAIEEELSRFCVDAGNRIPVTARHFILAKVFEMVQLCSDLRADAAADRGAVQALKDQLVESRRKTAALHRRALLAETRTGLLHPVTVVDDAAHAAPASTQPGGCLCAAGALPAWDMSHVLHACPITTPHTSRIEPQDVYRAAGYPAILESARNRALLVRAVLALSDAIPGIVR